MINFKQTPDAIIFTVRVVPRASKNEIAGAFGGALKIKIAAPPVGGAANSELVKLLSKVFDVPKNAVEILGGQTSKIKQIQIENLTGEKFARILNLK